MAKRPRNLWKRPGNSFRIGQKKSTEPTLDEQRITLYLPAKVLDWAEDQATRAGVATVQIYCTALLRGAIEAERDRDQLADVEARRGSLEGFHAIADDPEYLAEWNASANPRDRGPIQITGGSVPNPAPITDQSQAKSLMVPTPEPSAAALAVQRHAASGTDQADTFLAAIRRGEAVAEPAAKELLQALNALEVEYRNAPAIDRRVAYALHRLAFEGQVLHTDAWPGSLDSETVNLLRVVQEAVDRILSGEDIRYYAAES